MKFDQMLWDKTFGNLQITVALIFLSIHRHGRHLLLFSSKFPLKPVFIEEDLQSKFASKQNETNLAMFFNFFLSYDEINKTLNHFLRKFISTHNVKNFVT